MKLLKFLFVTASLALAGGAFAATHTWTAGSDYEGEVNVAIGGGVPVVWYCSGGKCVLNGPWGSGLNMQACQNLARRVGTLSYYRNDTGKEWSAKKQPNKLAQCNQAAK